MLKLSRDEAVEKLGMYFQIGVEVELEVGGAESKKIITFSDFLDGYIKRISFTEGVGDLKLKSLDQIKIVQKLGVSKHEDGTHGVELDEDFVEIELDCFVEDLQGMIVADIAYRKKQSKGLMSIFNGKKLKNNLVVDIEKLQNLYNLIGRKNVIENVKIQYLSDEIEFPRPLLSVDDYVYFVEESLEDGVVVAEYKITAIDYREINEFDEHGKRITAIHYVAECDDNKIKFLDLGDCRRLIVHNIHEGRDDDKIFDTADDAKKYREQRIGELNKAINSNPRGYYVSCPPAPHP